MKQYNVYRDSEYLGMIWASNPLDANEKAKLEFGEGVRAVLREAVTE